MSAPTIQYVTATQFAAWCGVCSRTIHKWSDKKGKEIPYFRTPGDHRRYLPQVVHGVLKRYGYPIPDELTAMLASTSTDTTPAQSAA
jgi:hypothetical protein